MSILKTSISLPCGVAINNRIAKSAMSENLSTRDNGVNDTLINAYAEWAKGNTGIIVTGNIMIDSTALGEPLNVVIEDESQMDLLVQWANTTKGTDSQLWAQINHPGRQAMEQINAVLKAPSAVPVHMTGRKNASKKIPLAMSEEEILDCIERFGNTARILKDAGFAGVQIHGAHGYLVNQFLSPLTNIREDKWGGSLENRARFVLEIYDNIRSKVGKDFPVGIKLNSADFQKGGFTEEESMEIIKMLSKRNIDLIEISGGTYEAPAMMGSRKHSTKKREAYFLDFIEKARKVTDTPLMLTGGFRTVSVMEDAINNGHLDIVGLARPFAVFPYLSQEIFDGKRTELKFRHKTTGVKMIDAALNLVWYEAQIKRIGQGKGPKLNINPWLTFFKYVASIIKKRS